MQAAARHFFKSHTRYFFKSHIGILKDCYSLMVHPTYFYGFYCTVSGNLSGYTTEKTIRSSLLSTLIIPGYFLHFSAGPTVTKRCPLIRPLRWLQ